MNEQFDLISIGDSTVDTFIKVHDASVECDVNHKDCKICVKYGEKIPVDNIGHGVAGNAANVVVGCSKLGLKSAIYTNLGNDQAGATIKKTFQELSIATDYVYVEKDKETNLSVVLTFQGERTIFVYHQPWYYQLPKMVNCSWLYLTSMAESFTNSNIMNEICHYVDQSGAKLVFNPGTYQLKANVKRYPKILEKCTLFIVNLEEAKKILEINQLETVQIKDLLSKLHLLGPRNIVITDGAEGSYGSDGSTFLKVGTYPTKLIEKTGAGDAYTSGLISALFYQKSLGEAMIWGAINSAHVIQKLGAQNGLLTKGDLEHYRETTLEFVATSF